MIVRWSGLNLFDEAESADDFGSGLEVGAETPPVDKAVAESGGEESQAEEEVEDDNSEISFADFLKSEGLDYEGEDSLDLARKVAADAKRAREAEFRANQYEQMQRYQEQLRASQLQQPPQPVAPAQPQHPEYFTNFMNRANEFGQMKNLFARKPKSFDFSDRITYDEHGEPVPRNPADYTAVREMNEAAAWLREYNAQVATNLPDFITYQVTHDPTIGYIINQAVRAAAQQNIQQYTEPIQVRDRAEKLWMEYADKCYDEKEQLTPYGEIFVNAVQTLRQQGMDNPDQVFTIADGVAKATALKGQTSAGTSSAEVTKAKAQLQTLRKASSKSVNAAGSLPKSSRQSIAPPGQRMTLEQKMLLQAGLG